MMIPKRWTEGDDARRAMLTIVAAGEAQLMRGGEEAGRPLVEQVQRNLRRVRS